MKKSFLDKILSHQYIRPAVLITLSLLLMFGVAVGFKSAFTNGRDVLDYEEVEIESCKYNNLRYDISAKCTLDGKYISDFKYYVENKTLHVTFYATPVTEELSQPETSSDKVFPAPEGLEPIVRDKGTLVFEDDGSVSLEIFVDKKPDKVVYAYGNYEKKLTVTE